MCAATFSTAVLSVTPVAIFYETHEKLHCDRGRCEYSYGARPRTSTQTDTDADDGAQVLLRRRTHLPIPKRMQTDRPVTQKICTGLLQARTLVLGNGAWGKVVPILDI